MKNKELCPDCEGKKEVDDFDRNSTIPTIIKRKCPTCKGSGRLHRGNYKGAD